MFVVVVVAVASLQIWPTHIFETRKEKSPAVWAAESAVSTVPHSAGNGPGFDPFPVFQSELSPPSEIAK